MLDTTAPLLVETFTLILPAREVEVKMDIGINKKLKKYAILDRLILDTCNLPVNWFVVI